MKIKNFIAVDWGSTHLRAWLCQDGLYTDSRQLEAGVTRLAGRKPKDILQQITEGWGQRQTPVIMAGMIGSLQGWCHVPYLSCPLRLTELTKGLTQVEENVWIVPGVSIASEGDLNIMRGEETQLLGAWLDAPSSLYVMPGTHSKWAWVETGQIQRFSTVMTGELHHLLLNHSLIGRDLPPQEADQKTFVSALEQALSNDDILPQLFAVRAAYILDRQPRETVSERLSGLLIGAEIAQMKRIYGALDGRSVTVVGSQQLTARYLTALSMSGVKANTLKGETAFQQGIRSIVNEMGN